MHYSKTKKMAPKEKFAQTVITLLIFLFSLTCLLSMGIVVIGAFSSEASIHSQGFSFFPSEWSLAAFRYVSTFSGQLIQSYVVTIIVTASGTALSLILSSMFAFVLSRKTFRLNKFLSIYLLLTMLLNGGILTAFLINTQLFNLADNILVLIVPMSVNAFNVIVMRSFIVSNVPDAIVEAAEIDGANEMQVFFRVVMPLLKPVMAAIGFMVAIAYWNDWQWGFLYITEPRLTPLQLLLIRIERNIDFMQQHAQYLSPAEMEMARNAPSESARMMILLLTIVPVMFIYPFFQKHFIKGITIGSVKG